MTERRLYKLITGIRALGKRRGDLTGLCEPQAEGKQERVKERKIPRQGKRGSESKKQPPSADHRQEAAGLARPQGAAAQAARAQPESRERGSLVRWHRPVTPVPRVTVLRGRAWGRGSGSVVERLPGTREAPHKHKQIKVLCPSIIKRGRAWSDVVVHTYNLSLWRG